MSNDIDRAEPSSRGGGGGGGPDPARTTDSSRGAPGFEERLSAVERALTGSDAAVTDLGDEAEAEAERDALGERLDDLESRIEELEAATQALRGYAGSIRAVNREVERRADLALARASDGGDAADRKRPDDRNSTAHDERDRAAPADHDERDHAAPADHDERDDPYWGDADDSVVPSESALDAALPSDPVEDDGIGREADKEEESWGTDALDRLRESL